VQEYMAFATGNTRQLVGHVYGHPKIKDGELIRTSPLVGIDVKRKTATTLNTQYTLGVQYKKKEGSHG
jgi:hypothetical protein